MSDDQTPVSDKERRQAAQLWVETGYVFTTATGGPLNPRTGYTEWKNLLKAANYQHITASIRRDVAQRVGGLFWEPAETADESDDEDGAARVPVPA